MIPSARALAERAVLGTVLARSQQAVSPLPLAAALQQPAALTAYDVLTEKQLPFAEGGLQLTIGSLEHVVVWLKVTPR